MFVPHEISQNASKYHDKIGIPIHSYIGINLFWINIQLVSLDSLRVHCPIIKIDMFSLYGFPCDYGCPIDDKLMLVQVIAWCRIDKLSPDSMKTKFNNGMWLPMWQLAKMRVNCMVYKIQKLPWYTNLQGSLLLSKYTQIFYTLTHGGLGYFNEILNEYFSSQLQWLMAAIPAVKLTFDLTDDKSTLVQVMAWCRQATNHNLIQCWPNFLSPYGVTRP